jgi:hypothetical protein
MTKLKSDQVACSCGQVVHWLDALPNNKPRFSEGQICRDCYNRNQDEYFAQKDQETARLKRIQRVVDRSLYRSTPLDWTRTSEALRTGGDVEAAFILDTASINSPEDCEGVGDNVYLRAYIEGYWNLNHQPANP